jgi:hypothetical protein
MREIFRTFDCDWTVPASSISNQSAGQSVRKKLSWARRGKKKLKKKQQHREKDTHLFNVEILHQVGSVNGGG